MPVLRSARRSVAALAALATATALLVGCAAPESDRSIRVGTTLELTSLDPAQVHDPDAIALLHQLHPRLIERDPETGDLAPALAQEAGFTSETEYTVSLTPGLSFANGDALTASDVVFSFERQFAIPSGAVTRPLLASLASVAAIDATTVVFTLSQPDPGFMTTLAGPAGAILDEEVFSADAFTPMETIVAAGAFGGELQIVDLTDETFTFLPARDDPRSPTARRIVLETGVDADSLGERLGSDFDAVFGDLSADAHRELGEREGVTSRSQPSNDIRLLAFDFATQPFGSATEEADEEKALAVRQAVADLIDRGRLAARVPASWSPAFGYLPDVWRPGGVGASTSRGVLSGDGFGDGAGGAAPARAAERLAAAGVSTPVRLDVSWVGSAGDPDAAALSAELESQLELTELFTVTVTQTDAGFDRATMSEERRPLLELVWTPLGVGAGSYFAPLYSSSKGLPIGSAEERTDELIVELQAATVAEERLRLIDAIEQRLAARLPAIPLLSGQNVLYLAPGVGDQDDIPELRWFDSLARL